MRARRTFVLALVGLAALASVVLADTRVVMREGTAIEGDASELPEAMRKSFAEAEPKTVTYWLAADRMARIGEGTRLIGRLDRGESYVVDPKEKSYTVLELGGEEPPPETPEKTWKLVESTDTRQIAGWKAVRRTMTVNTGHQEMEIVLWVSGQAPVGIEALRSYIEAVASSPAVSWMRAYLELDGFPLRQEVRMGPILSWQEVVSITEESPPPGTYEVPEGYRRND